MVKALRTSVRSGGLRQGGLQPGIGSDNIFATASLDLDFARHKNLGQRVDATTGSNLVDFTRASSGTYVGSDGLIKTATTNLLLRSEEFDNSWARAGILAFGSGSTADVTTAPNGVDSADLITEDTATSSVHRVIQSGLTVSAVSCTVSVYAKRANGTRNLEINANALTNARAVFDLGTGTVGEISSGTAAIQSVSNGWYRCSVTGVSSGTTTSVFLQLATSTTASSSIYTGDGTSGIYIWGAQLEQSSTVGEYVKTTSTINSAPRFDHDPTTGESLGLLVEESRTNSLTDSEDLTGQFKADVTVPFDSSVVNPTGSTGSYKILADSGLSGGSNGGIRIFKSTSPADNIVASAFVKKSTHRYVYIGFGGLVNSFTALFDIEPGLTSNRLLGQSGNGTFTNIDAGYQNLPNDWIRIWAVGTTTGTNGPTVGLGPDAATFNITNWTAAGTEEIYAWGLQYEDNVSFPTSYIPTEGSTVTRAADVASISGSNYSGWFNASEGSLYGEAQSFQSTASATALAVISDATLSNRWEVDLRAGTAGGAGRTTIKSNGSNSFDTSNKASPVFVTNQNYKIASAAAANNFGYSFAGGVAVQDSSGAMPISPDRMEIGNRSNALVLNGTIRRLVYWPQRLPNEVLQTITQ